MEDIYAGIIDKMIGNETKGVDHYNHNGSTWLIFTDEKKWVIEFTKEGTLWYNYNFFQNCFKLMSLDVVENQHYITKWVEDTILSGVRNTDSWVGKPFVSVEYTIQNGVKETKPEYLEGDLAMEEVIQNGIKETIDQWNQNRPSVKDVVEKGVKLTNSSLQIDGSCVVEDVIQNGVRNTFYVLSHELGFIEDTIQNGVKHIEPGGYLGSIEMKGKIVHQFESPKQNNEVEDTIQNGLRKIEGEPHDYPHTVANIIKNGVKHTEYGDWEDGDERFDDIIKNGVKETKQEEHHRLREVVQTVKNGIKETRLEQNITEGEIDDIIQDGVKLTNSSLQIDGSCIVEDVIQNGIKKNSRETS